MQKRIRPRAHTTTRDDKDGAAPVVVRHSVARTCSGRPAARREADQPDGKPGRQCVLRQAPRPVGGGARLRPPRAAAHQGAGNRSRHTDQRTAERRCVSPGQCRTADGTDREGRRDGWRNATVGRERHLVARHLGQGGCRGNAAPRGRPESNRPTPVPARRPSSTRRKPSCCAIRQRSRCRTMPSDSAWDPLLRGEAEPSPNVPPRHPAAAAGASRRHWNEGADLEMVAGPGPTRLSRPPRRPPFDAGGQDRAAAWANPFQEDDLPFTSTGARRASRRHRSPAMIGRFRPRSAILADPCHSRKRTCGRPSILSIVRRRAQPRDRRSGPPRPPGRR